MQIPLESAASFLMRTFCLRTFLFYLAFLGIQVLVSVALYAGIFLLAAIPADHKRLLTGMCCSAFVSFLFGLNTYNVLARRPFTVVEFILVPTIAIIYSLRVVSLPFAVLALFALAANRYRLALCSWVLFVALAASPVDVFLIPSKGQEVLHGGPSGEVVHGGLKTGPRLVKTASGCMPIHHLYAERYGEYIISYNPSLFRPIWLIVWR